MSCSVVIIILCVYTFCTLLIIILHVHVCIIYIHIYNYIYIFTRYIINLFSSYMFGYICIKIKLYIFIKSLNIFRNVHNI